MHKIGKTRDALFVKHEMRYDLPEMLRLKLLQVKQVKRILGTEAFIKVNKKRPKISAVRNHVVGWTGFEPATP